MRHVRVDASQLLFANEYLDEVLVWLRTYIKIRCCYLARETQSSVVVIGMIDIKIRCRSLARETQSSVAIMTVVYHVTRNAATVVRRRRAALH